MNWIGWPRDAAEWACLAFVVVAAVFLLGRLVVALLSLFGAMP